MEFQSCLNAIKGFGFKVSWTFLKVGYKGYNEIPPQITKQNICQYALNVLKEMDSGYEEIACLVAAENDYEFDELLDTLVKLEKVDIELQKTKWRVYIVNQELGKLNPGDYVNGLLELTSLWISLGLPDDYPHIIQGLNNSYSPQEYYTKDVFEMLLKVNKDWVNNEVKAINLLESSN